MNRYKQQLTRKNNMETENSIQSSMSIAELEKLCARISAYPKQVHINILSIFQQNGVTINQGKDLTHINMNYVSDEVLAKVVEHIDNYDEQQRILEELENKKNEFSKLI